MEKVQRPKKLVSNVSVEISVIMAVFNAERYLAEAIESVLSQTFVNFELIMVDDGSTDNSRDILNRFNDERIEIIWQPNSGPASARNNGIKRAKGKYIAILDADDLCLPERLEIQYNFLRTNLDCIAVGSNAHVIDEHGRHIYTSDISLTSEELKNGLPHKMPFRHPSVMYQKDAFVKAGMYPDIAMIEDVLLFIRMAPFGEFANIKQPLIKYRLSPSASSARNKETQKALRDAVTYYSNFGSFEGYSLQEINDSISRTTQKGKYFRYYLLVAKKYLWNNYQPKQARRHLLLAIKLKPYTALPYALFLMSFLGFDVIRLIYRALK